MCEQAVKVEKKKKLSTCSLFFLAMKMCFRLQRVTDGVVVTFFFCYELLVLEMFVGGWSAPPPHPAPFFFPSLTWSQEYPSMQRGISSCLPMSGPDMGHRTIVLRRLCFLNNQGRGKNADSLNERICVCIEIWTFFLMLLDAFVCLTWSLEATTRELDLLVPLFSSIVQSQQWSVRYRRKHLPLTFGGQRRTTTCCASACRVTTRWTHS